MVKRLKTLDFTQIGLLRDFTRIDLSLRNLRNFTIHVQNHPRWLSDVWRITMKTIKKYVENISKLTENVRRNGWNKERRIIEMAVSGKACMAYTKFTLVNNRLQRKSNMVVEAG
jgi:hypothetical protein